ncbi:methyl-accepting chemotaxis protein [Paenibacillus sp. PK4536]|uniref:methyl-accepting chemotaxis protein n=1 Tax=Paenibacillus sp. PK4536 TaxID=3024576 RepID=UPI0023595730|nr:methyl-accepting chemotaxis protein [Paenibacillus sp. PK4536]WIM38351.1 methyl-accepting chemotaxis protein [Paenibacillus sp. PK4536]
MKNWKVRTKIITLIVVNLLILIMLSATGTLMTNKMSKVASNMYEVNMRSLTIMDQIIMNYGDSAANLLELMQTTDPTANKALVNLINATTASNKEQFELMGQMALSPANQKLAAELVPLATAFSEQRDNISALAASNENEQAFQAYANLSNQRTQLNEVLNAMRTNLIDEGGNAKVDSDQQYAQSQWITGILFAIGLIVSLLLGTWIVRLIVRPLNNVQLLMTNASDGDLTVHSDYVSKDEIGQLSAGFNTMISSIREITKKVDESAMTLSASSEQLTASAEQTAKASSHIATSSGELSTGFESQVETVNQVTNATNEMTDKMKQLQTSNKNIQVLTNHMEETAGNGINEVQEITHLINDLASNIQDNLNVLTSLNQKSDEIGLASQAIQQIAKQTNLLALNASIEAARAGESGRGFAVVADEIRKLAEGAAQSSTQITALISDVQSESQKAVEQVHTSVNNVQAGVQSSERVNVAFEAIRQAVADTVEQIGGTRLMVGSITVQSQQISEAMEHLSALSEQGSAGIQEMNAASEEQLSTMEEVSESARYLSSLAEDLQQLLAGFKL